MSKLDICSADDLYGFNNVIRVLLQSLLKLRADGEHGCGTVRIARMDAHCIDILNEADSDHLVLRIPDNLQLKLLPSQDRFFNKDLVNYTCRESPACHCTEFFKIVYQATP